MSAILNYYSADNCHLCKTDLTVRGSNDEWVIKICDMCDNYSMIMHVKYNTTKVEVYYDGWWFSQNKDELVVFKSGNSRQLKVPGIHNITQELCKTYIDKFEKLDLFI